MLECLQLGALLWWTVGFCALLWFIGAVPGWWERRRRARVRRARMELAEDYWRRGRMVWMSQDAPSVRALSMDVLPWCIEPEQPGERQDVPAAFRRAFGEEERAG